ncbi:penicillin amidase [Arboricoccus pini]|uniref:Penicillin amidase n=1 Tax=Arboricoccus pini TaxID=1963835 RepID=A0A212RVU7_9PROT|nr:penicillin acylase family protein [Arboricoccus pini]SNB76693.1 penicillin amidase [Arboricoccus pini]
MVQRTRIELEGLKAAAEIVVDTSGIPHLRAESRADLFLVQGFNAARDRLWQLDLWRKRGLGLLASDFGPGYLMQDQAARLFLYRGDMTAEWAAYGTPNTRAIVQAFVSGINAFIELTQADPSWLPPEFAAFGTKPGRFAAEDVVRIRSHALARNMLAEVARARVAAAGALAADIYRKDIAPPHVLALPDGLDPALIPAGVEDMFLLATAPVTFRPDRLAASLAEAPLWSKVNAQGEVVAEASALSPFEGREGSNNWAVAPSRTTTGRPILASDPHRAHLLPSLRYIAHLTCPDLDLIGAGEPALPGLSLGHNGKAAFSLTIFPADQEDLYVCERHPSDPRLYRYGDGYEPFQTVEETIPVKDASPQPVTLSFTRHGPLIHATATHAFALRTVWQEPGTAPYLGSLAYMDCASVEGFEAALASWASPTVNQVYADTSGRIARITAGKVPRRRNFDGLLPVPGDGRYEWHGFWTTADLPRAIDPPEGFVFSANEMNLPPGDPNLERHLGYEWLEASRAVVISRHLADQAPHGIEAAMRLQNDVTSLPALRVQAVLLAQEHGDWSATATRAQALLADWDGRLLKASAPALLFEIWWMRHLKPALLAGLVADPAVRAKLTPLDNEPLLVHLEAMAREALHPVLTASLEQAWEDCAARLGPDPAFWSWGRLHHAHFIHPQSCLPGSPGRDVGPLELGGSNSTVMNAGYDPGSFRTNVGATFRMVLDVGHWDSSFAINAPGQSGDPRSPHYDDLAALWAEGRYVPLLYSQAEIDRAAEHVVELRPKPAT